MGARCGALDGGCRSAQRSFRAATVRSGGARTLRPRLKGQRLPHRARRYQTRLRCPLSPAARHLAAFFFDLAALSHQRRSVNGRFGNGGKHNRTHSMDEHRGRLFRSVSGAADKVMSHVPEPRHTGAVTVQSCTSETRTPDRWYHDAMSISYRMGGRPRLSWRPKLFCCVRVLSLEGA